MSEKHTNRVQLHGYVPTVLPQKANGLLPRKGGDGQENEGRDYELQQITVCGAAQDLSFLLCDNGKDFYVEVINYIFFLFI